MFGGFVIVLIWLPRAIWDHSSLTGIEPMALAVKTRTSNHWKAREFSRAFLSGEEGEEIRWGGGEVGVSQRQLCYVTV